MKTVKVKICGIRDFETAQVAIAIGADFIGLNFIPSSRRYINPKVAKEILNELKDQNDTVRTKIVGVFQNQSISEVNTLADILELDFVQLHGDEDIEYISQMKTKIFKKVTQKELKDQNYELVKSRVAYFLLDRPVQGVGKMIDIDTAVKVSKRFPIFLAGGLTTENVISVISKVKPYGVDVASGIETDGKVDGNKIKQFVETVKGSIL